MEKVGSAIPIRYCTQFEVFDSLEGLPRLEIKSVAYFLTLSCYLAIGEIIRCKNESTITCTITM